MSHHYIQFDNVSYTYPGSKVEALKEVSFRISHGERVALLGLNGSGKSTLMLQTNGLLFPSSGEVNIGDIPVSKKTVSLVRQSVGMVFQDADDQLFMPSVEEDVAFGPRNMKLPESEVERRVVNALSAVGCLDLRKRSAWELSGGQRRAVAIATVLSMEPAILVLDEPTANLDMEMRNRLLSILENFHHTVLIATHDIDLARNYCSRALLMSHGSLIADGPTQDVINIYLNRSER